MLSQIKPNYRLLPYFLIILTIMINSCRIIMNCDEGEGEVIEKELKLESFNAIDLEFPAVVYLSQSTNQRVKIKTNANIIDLLNKEVHDGEWEIGFHHCIEVEETVEIYIDIPTIDGIQVYGSGKVINKEKMDVDRLKLGVSGSGELQLNLDAKSINTRINGSGDVVLNGMSKLHDVEINGSGDVQAKDLSVDEYEIEINGSGDVEISVSDHLDVEINGSGDVSYTGNPKEISSRINGSGNLNQIP